MRNIEVCVFRHQKSTIYLLTPWFRDLLEKLTGLQLVKKLSAFHGTRSSITAITSVRKPACECFLTEFFYREGLLAPRPTPKLEDHLSSAVRDCLFNLFAATLLKVISVGNCTRRSTMDFKILKCPLKIFCSIVFEEYDLEITSSPKLLSPVS